MSDQQQNKGNVEQFGYKQEVKRALSLRDVVPVSYTHLDVNKRQPTDRRCPRW